MNVVQFVIDEAASLGRLQTINDMIQIGRGYGIRLVLIYQALGQLKICFPNGEDETLRANVTTCFFAVNDNATATYVSDRLGEATIIVDSGGSSSGTSYQSSKGAQPHTSDGTSHNSNRNWSQQTRRLLKPEEVMALPPRTAITFAPNVPPVCSTLLRYYEEKNLGGSGILTRARLAVATLAASVVFFVMSAGTAAVLTHEMNAASETTHHVTTNPSHAAPAYRRR
jgi:type IV secretion system protein VirD4